MPSSDITGSWTYRSFRNDAAPVDGDPNKALALFFAEAEFRFTAVTPGAFNGVIDWGSGGLDMTGTMLAGSTDMPNAFSIVGVGRPGTQTEGWRYEYNGAVAYRWPAGVQQVPALIGSVIRALPHNGAPAGYTASFIAVRQA